MQAIWKRLYKTSSGVDAGTLYQLRNLLQRRSVTKKIKCDPTAGEDFFLCVVDAHIVLAAMNIFGMLNIEDKPSTNLHIFQQGKEKPNTLVSFIKDNLIEKFVDMTWPCTSESDPSQQDYIRNYASEVITLGLFYKEYNDAIREGDGERILRCWRYLLLIFKASDKRKYSVEAIHLLAQHHFLFSKRMAQQLIWSRTVNIHGKSGKNISLDLHMEHLNKKCKQAISHLGANVAGGTIERVGRSLKNLTDIQLQYDKTLVYPLSQDIIQGGKHPKILEWHCNNYRMLRFFQKFHNGSIRSFLNFEETLCNQLIRRN